MLKALGRIPDPQEQKLSKEHVEDGQNQTSGKRKRAAVKQEAAETTIVEVSDSEDELRRAQVRI